MPATGLTNSEDKALRLRLAKLTALEPGRAYLGGVERFALDDIKRALTARLEPTPVNDLLERADKYLGDLDQFEWARKAMSEAQP